MAGSAVLVIHAEVALAQELEGGGGLRAGQAGLHLGVGEHLQGAGVEAVQEVLVPGVRLGVGEQVVVQPHLGVHGGGGVHPMNGRALHLPAVGGVAAPAVGIVLGQNGGDVARRIGLIAGALDHIGAS